MSAAFDLGGFGDCAIIHGKDGVIPVDVCSYSVAWDCASYARVQLDGILREPDVTNPKAAQNKLRNISMTDLLFEVNRRIKNGENVRRRMIGLPRRAGTL